MAPVISLRFDDLSRIQVINTEYEVARDGAVGDDGARAANGADTVSDIIGNAAILE
jgi:hypothetical protein